MRRYVAIVPYQSKRSSAAEINTLLQASVLLIWFFGAILFTLLRIFINNLLKTICPPILKPISKMTIFFRSLAVVLCNSAGCSRGMWKSEKFLVFFMGIFALITSTIFTGNLFDQMFVDEKPIQINSMAELKMTNMSILECMLDLYSYNLYVSISTTHGIP